MSETVSHKQRTRMRILDEAARAMRVEGSEQLGVAALMKRVGLTHGGFYVHFGSRDDLVAQAVGRMAQDTAGLVSRHLGGADRRRGLAGLVDDYLSERACAARDRSCPIPSLVSEAARMPGPARDAFAADVGLLRDAIAAALVDLGRDGPQALADSALSEMVGAMALARALPDGRRASEILAAARSSVKDRLGVADDNDDLAISRKG